MSRGQKQTMRNARVDGEMSVEERVAFKQEIAAIDAESNPPMPPLITWKTYIV
jgi:hypothetical protein